MSRRVAIVVVIGLVLAPLAATGAAAAPPSPPAAYYGEVTVNGEPAPAGVTVDAVVDGEVRASLTTAEGGTLGGASAFDEKLVVDGSEGENVTFRVGSQNAETVAWEGGAHERISLAVTDSAAPTPAVSAPESVPAGTTVRFDAAGSTDDVGIVDYEWTLPDGTTVTGETADVTFEQAGERTLELAVTDAVGNTATTTASVDVTDTGGDDSNPGNSNPGGADDAPPADDTDDAADEPATDVVVGADAVNVEFTNLAADTPATVAFPDTAATSQNGVALNGLTLSTTRQTNVTLDVSVSEAVPASAESVGSGAMLYLNVSESVPEDALGEVIFDFTVSDERLAATDTDPGDVSLWRYHDGEWAQLDTSVVEQDGDTHRFRATSPGLSVFAVRGGSADVSISSAELGQSSVTAGDSVTVFASLVNDGSVDGTVTVPFVVDGETVAERTVSVPANGERTISVAYTPDSEGTYDVQAGNVSAGTLDVAAVQTTDSPDGTTVAPTTAPTDNPDQADQPDNPQTPPEREPGGFSATSVAAVGLIVAAVLGLFMLARRRA